MERNYLPAIVWFLPAFLCVAALAPLPYGFYTLLRLAVCVSALAISHSTWRLSPTWGVALIVVALVFNPIIPVFLARPVWAFLDLAAAGVYVCHWSLVVRPYRTR